MSVAQGTPGFTTIPKPCDDAAIAAGDQIAAVFQYGISRLYRSGIDAKSVAGGRRARPDFC